MNLKCSISVANYLKYYMRVITNAVNIYWTLWYLLIQNVTPKPRKRTNNHYNVVFCVGKLNIVLQCFQHDTNIEHSFK